ncbi:MAG: M28 family peptidase [Clostridia bacterium]|jgi:aminopeptidase YwaD|nr:M28 family peptidase [Clostridia bacterium]
MKFFIKVFILAIVISGTLIMLPKATSNFSPVEPSLEEVEPEPVKTLSQQLYELQGRGAGTTYERQAAEILAAYFEEIGLNPWPEYPSYLQEFNIGTVTSFKEEGRTRFRTAGPPRYQSQNVIGYLPGQDPEGKWIIFGAHYDGQGEVNGTIYPSANDNLSGIMALTALAKSLAAEPRLNYTLCFVAFGAEEPGLLGAQHLVANLPVPVEKIQAVINLDTIGKTCDTLLIYTTEHNPLASALSPVFHRYGFQVSVILAAGTSDHYPFSLQGIPAVTIATENWLEGNHTPQDTLEDVDRIQVGRIAGALKQSLYYLVR